jgi:hypothetical protein
MSRDETLRALRRLRDGRDPLTGDVLPPDHLCQRADVIRTLFAAVQTIEAARGGGAPPAAAGAEAPAEEPAEQTLQPLPERPRRPRPPNAGQPWSEDEDRRLVEAFDGGAAEREIAAAFGRSRTSIRARLMRLGRGALLDEGPAPRYPVEGDETIAVPTG